ncbi:MAG TPA: tetratricopeptide repeat protein [Bryobacteraceae bacterium]|nr:tetratricopeptide repeat protein [Bryobacteraceae bacterium]
MRRIRISVFLLATGLPVSSSWAQIEPGDPMALARQAVALQQSGDDADAAAAYRKLLTLRPDDVATHVNLGVVLVHLGRFEEAIAEYEAAEKLLPGDPRIALNLALAHEKSGRLMEAEQRFESLHRAVPEDAKITMLLADCHLQMSDYQRVIDLLQPLETQNPDDLGIAYMLGMALLHQQRIQEGQALLDRILRNGDSAEARFLLGTRMFESGDYPAAARQLASAVELNPQLPELQSLYGQALLNTGDADAAASAFRKELAVHPNDYVANLRLGQILTARRQFVEAMLPLRRALLLRPQSAEAKQTLAECLSGAGRFEEARGYAESATQARPDSPEAHETLAVVYKGLHLTAEAAREHKLIESIEKAADASAPGPKVNEKAPDFDLPEIASGRRVRLGDFRGKHPVVLVFGSYSCPNFRTSAASLKALQKLYGPKIPFLLIYIREAHAGDMWQSTRNLREGVNLAPATTLAEKEDHAAMCSRKLQLGFPALVDGMDGGVETAYSAWPSRAFIIGVDGRILYSTRLTELDFHVEEMESVLRQLAPDRKARKK